MPLSLIRIANLWVQVLQDDQVLFDVVVPLPSGVVTPGYVNHFGVLAAIQADNALASDKVGHMVENLEMYVKWILKVPSKLETNLSPIESNIVCGYLYESEPFHSSLSIKPSVTRRDRERRLATQDKSTTT